MSRYLKISIVVIIVVSLFYVATIEQSSIQAQDTFDRRAMLASIVKNVIFPAQEAFVDITVQLETDAHTFADNPTVDNLTTLQNTWRQTASSWEQIAIYGLDLRLEVTHNQIDKPPLNVEFVEDILSGEDEITEAYIEGIGSTSRGLPAIEYLIFNPQLTDDEIVASFDDHRRMQYLVALAENIHNKAIELHEYWADEDGRYYAETFIEQDLEGGKLQGTINMVINEMFFYLENDLQMWIGEPSGIATGEDPQPDLVESPRSGQSLQHILNHLIGLQLMFNGGVDDEALGFDDYLDFLEAEFEGRPLSEIIDERFDIAITNIQAVEQPLQIAIVENPEQIAEVYESMRQLIIPVRSDMGSHLNILVTLSDRDGDQ